MYDILIATLIAGFGAQVLKILIETIQGKKTWKDPFVYGGMPSSHAAFVGALVTGVGIADGLNSTTFAIALIFAILVIRDAAGLRRRVGYHGIVLKKLIADVRDKSQFPEITTRLGHTPLEITAGLALGFIVTYWWMLLR
ncbi:MAG: divergent PAP2 family protein [Patescibacteria group bacterium]|nr:divergent PAP2 family protein [Patescibacteria group bacterium]MDD5490356.1 divergent PAP2 family protein [Patescibacteria group bacterium]